MSRMGGGSNLYEIQIYSGGTWRAAGTLGNREDAIAKAKELAENPRYLSVKVISERFDDSRGVYVQQTVYRSAIIQEPENRARKGEETYQRLAQSNRNRQRLRAAQLARKKREKEQQRERIHFVLGIILRLILIVGLGGGVLYWLLTSF